MRRLFSLFAAVHVTAFFCVGVGASLAQPSGQLPSMYEGAGIDEQLGGRLPLDVDLLDETGRTVSIGSFFQRNRPVLLNFVYYECPMLCSLLIDGLTRTLRQMDWRPGEQFDVVTISFAAGEGADLAARQKQKAADRMGQDAVVGWHFLTGDEEGIRRLTEAVGFQFKWVEEEEQFVHPATIIFVSPDGILTRYLHGLEFEPRAVRTALVEASNGTVGTFLDQVILFCFRYDPEKGSYALYAVNIMKLGGLLTLVVLGTLLFVFWRRENRNLDESRVAGTVPDHAST